MGAGQDEGLVHLAMQVPAVVPVVEQAKPVAQSALVVQLVLQAVPPTGQMKWLAQVLGAAKLQVPAPHVGASTRLGEEQLAGPQVVPDGNEQVPVLRHVPLQAVTVFPATTHCVLSQQLALGMHRLSLQSLKPVVVGQLQTPAPEQVKLVPHDVEVLPPQTPLEQVPALSRLLTTAGSHVTAPHAPVAATHLPAVQVPLQLMPSAPLQSLLSQQLATGMQPPAQDLKFAAQVEHRPAPEQVKPALHGVVAPGRQDPLEQVPAATLLLPEQDAVPQPPVG